MAMEVLIEIQSCDTLGDWFSMPLKAPDTVFADGYWNWPCVASGSVAGGYAGLHSDDLMNWDRNAPEA
jgi:hypothetical protein